MSQNTISRYETGEREPGIAELLKIADYFNVSVDYILGLTDEKHNKVCEDRLYRHFKEYEWLMLEFAELKPEYQDAVKSVVKTLYNNQKDKK